MLLVDTEQEDIDVVGSAIVCAGADLFRVPGDTRQGELTFDG